MLGLDDLGQSSPDAGRDLVLVVATQTGRLQTEDHDRSPGGSPCRAEAPVGIGRCRHDGCGRTPRFVGGSERVGTAGAAARPLCLGGLDGEPIGDVVPLVAVVALDPAERQLMGTVAIEVDERLPQVAVGHGLLLRVLPSPLQPALPPPVAKAVDDVGRVGHDLDLAREAAERIEHGHQSPCADSSIRLPRRWPTDRRERPRPSRRGRGFPCTHRRCRPRSRRDPATTTPEPGINLPRIGSHGLAETAMIGRYGSRPLQSTTPRHRSRRDQGVDRLARRGPGAQGQARRATSSPGCSSGPTSCSWVFPPPRARPTSTPSRPKSSRSSPATSTSSAASAPSSAGTPR